MSYIQVSNLSKKIKNNLVLNDINLSLNKGKIYGLVGENGSGKTMLLRIIGGIVRPTSGQVNLKSNNIGIIIENCSLYPNFSGYKNLLFLSKIKNIINEEDIKKTITEVGLNPNDKRNIKKYSLGMRQRLVFAQAIMEKPDILLLDEPTNSLDSEGIVLIRNLIKREAKRGALVLIASHNEHDISELCDVIYEISKGTIQRRTVI